MYPAVEIHLHLDHVCPAQASTLAAFGYAFRSLDGGTNLLPTRHARPRARAARPEAYTPGGRSVTAAVPHQRIRCTALAGPVW